MKNTYYGGGSVGSNAPASQLERLLSARIYKIIKVVALCALLVLIFLKIATAFSDTGNNEQETGLRRNTAVIASISDERWTKEKK